MSRYMALAVFLFLSLATLAVNAVAAESQVIKYQETGDWASGIEITNYGTLAFAVTANAQNQLFRMNFQTIACHLGTSVLAAQGKATAETDLEQQLFRVRARVDKRKTFEADSKRFHIAKNSSQATVHLMFPLRTQLLSDLKRGKTLRFEIQQHRDSMPRYMIFSLDGSAKAIERAESLCAQHEGPEYFD